MEFDKTGFSIGSAPPKEASNQNGCERGPQVKVVVCPGKAFSIFQKTFQVDKNSDPDFLKYFLKGILKLSFISNIFIFSLIRVSDRITARSQP